MTMIGIDRVEKIVMPWATNGASMLGASVALAMQVTTLRRNGNPYTAAQVDKGMGYEVGRPVTPRAQLALGAWVVREGFTFDVGYCRESDNPGIWALTYKACLSILCAAGMSEDALPRSVFDSMSLRYVEMRSAIEESGGHYAEHELALGASSTREFINSHLNHRRAVITTHGASDPDQAPQPVALFRPASNNRTTQIWTPQPLPETGPDPVIDPGIQRIPNREAMVLLAPNSQVLVIGHNPDA